MTTPAYEEVLALVKQLPFEEQIMLLKDLVKLLRGEIVSGRKHSILELEGLGKEIWARVDVEAYINEERHSW